MAWEHRSANGVEVYDISILANIPHSVSDILGPSAPTQRLRPLFTIGVHDIPFLLADGAMKRPGPAPTQQPGILGGDSGSGWIACTTDSILAMKEDLWDVLITMPPSHAANTKEKAWPTVESGKGAAVKATQRDLRRFRTLKAGLRRLAATSAVEVEEESPSNGTEPRRPSTLSNRRSRMSMSSIKTTSFFPEGEDSHMLADASDKIVEPMTWAALAYSGFMWWASAGEQRRSDEAEEQAYDNSLIADLLPAPSMHPPRESSGQRRPSGSFNVTAVQEGGGLGDSITSLTARRTPGTDVLSPPGHDDATGDDEEERARTELAIITYFHRLTSGILSTLAEVVEAAEDFDDMDNESHPQTGEGSGDQSNPLLHGGARSDNEEASRPQVRVDSDALAAMGLDVWSSADAEFVGQVADRYFGREAKVEGKGVELCGLRVC
jgi:hypothetical protein